MGFGKIRDRMRHLQKVVKDPKLSLEAKGFFAYIMAYPKNWNLSDIVRDTKVTEKQAALAFKELVRHGYIVVRKDE